MSLALLANSGKAAAIELEKEIEPSATSASVITLTFVFEVKAKAAAKILVNKNEVGAALPGEPATASEVQVTIVVAAGQKFEVKKATGLKEVLASVAPAQNTIAVADIETLQKEGRVAAEEASIKVNQELAEKNARLASATSK